MKTKKNYFGKIELSVPKMTFEVIFICKILYFIIPQNLCSIP